MAVTECTYGDFFVFTSGGYHLERIHFDRDFWLQLELNLIICWEKYVIPEVLMKENEDVVVIPTEIPNLSAKSL